MEVKNIDASTLKKWLDNNKAEDALALLYLLE